MVFLVPNCFIMLSWYPEINHPVGINPGSGKSPWKLGPQTRLHGCHGPKALHALAHLGPEIRRQQTPEILRITILVGGLDPSEKYESQLGWLFPIYGKIKNVPNHQPDTIYSIYIYIWYPSSPRDPFCNATHATHRPSLRRSPASLPRCTRPTSGRPLEKGSG